MSEGEYEVESIHRAKVEGGRGKKRQWFYWVKWRGYGMDDNTWEPPKSFEGGSEHFIAHFWSRVNTNGRDYKDIRQFSVNEEFFPAGPPRGKKTKKAREEEVSRSPTPTTVDVADSENEVRSLVEDEVVEVYPARGKRRRSSVGAGAEATAPKRKRKGPPGLRVVDLEETKAKEKILNGKRSAPNLRGESSRAQKETEPDASASTSGRSSSRKSQKSAKAAASRLSPSSDELITPFVKGKARKSRAKEYGPSAENFMDVDEVSDDPPSPFGSAALLAPPSEPAQPEPVPELEPQPQPRAPTPVRIPAHQARTAKPRVQQIDDPNLTETRGAISVKAKFMKPAATNGANGEASGSGRVPRSRAGPGRSSSGFNAGGSRLTAQKGKLTIVKPRKARVIQEVAQHDEPEVIDITQSDPVDAAVDPPPPPTAKELLEAAGIDVAAEDLPDFEADAEGEVDAEYTVVSRVSQTEPTSEHVSQPAEPAAVVLEARPLTFASRVTAAWNQSTIFGPLALGFTGIRSQGENETSKSSSETKRYTFCLNLDPAVSLPVVLKDVHASQSFLDGLDSSARSPTGKFYKDNHAVALADTLTSQGNSARIALSDGSNDGQKQHFKRFISRLQAGELFVQMNRAEILVMCASDNSVLTQKLGFPGQLVGLGDTAVVSNVSVEDISVYVDAVVHADTARW
ncbi:hypothetical protein C8Q74DRAFT_1362835 [Fomes fomentarius]|nr:hypothetical protein C8Q74DRAFT_1362835 [Fomes fomentarius]